MLYLPKFFLILSAVVENILYIQHLQNVSQMEISFQNDTLNVENNNNNNLEWIKMEPKVMNRRQHNLFYVFDVDLNFIKSNPTNIIKYKLKIEFSNGSVAIDEFWRNAIIDHLRGCEYSNGVLSTTEKSASSTTTTTTTQTRIPYYYSNYKENYLKNSIFYFSTTFNCIVLLLILYVIYKLLLLIHSMNK